MKNNKIIVANKKRRKSLFFEEYYGIEISHVERRVRDYVMIRTMDETGLGNMIGEIRGIFNEGQ